MVFRSVLPDIEIPSMSLPSFVLEHAAGFGDKPALIDGPSGRTITYAQLGGMTRALASGLSSRGFGTGDVFAIFSPNVPEYAVKRAEAEVTEGELMSWVSERVPSYEKVRRVEFIDEIPRSLSGKILRRVLVEKERGAR